MIASLLGFFWLIEIHGSSIEDKISFLATVWIPVSGKPPCTGAPGSRSETQQESKLSLSTEPALPSLSCIQSFSSSFCCQKADCTQFLPYTYTYIHIHVYKIYVLSKYVLKVIQGGLGPLQLPLCSWLGASFGPVAS